MHKTFKPGTDDHRRGEQTAATIKGGPDGRPERFVANRNRIVSTLNANARSRGNEGQDS